MKTNGDSKEKFGPDAAARAGAAAMGQAASDLTRATDAAVAAERIAQLAEIAATAGIVDVAEGAEILAASGDVSATSAIVGLMSQGDLEFGLALARTAGEISVVGDVADLLAMPALSEFLESRGELLQYLAVEFMLRAGGTRALSQALGSTAGELDELGAQEVAEGLVRRAASEELAGRSRELAAEGAELTERAASELEMAAAIAATVGERAVVGAGESTDAAEAGEGEVDAEAPDPTLVTGEAALSHDLSYVEGIGEVYGGKFKEIGVETPQALLERGATPAGRKELAESTGISEHLILKWVDEVDLYRVKGLGAEYSELLKASGVDTVPELAQRNPVHLYAKLVEVNEEHRHVRRVPSQSQVEDWIRQAKELPRVVSY